ncbi:related to Probable phosphomutase PMU1 [Hanseniaspora guilliermondii]|uniref:Related to Probable phosphomutase PMU1 n=1 Tax=Hanseniaspora guilliermondii TaxID=56406 RepID=A0A1L0CT39_9ASCO|nr:related to Probable phosphomutase PMU1 [Hanseniaspora guilliermondii]
MNKLIAEKDYFQVEPTLNSGIDTNYAFVKPFDKYKSIQEIISKIEDLPNTRLFILARHGQGYHNAAVERYGEDVWDAKWAFKNGDGVLEDWNDANLTSKGINQVKRTGKVVFGEKMKGLWPDSYYCSPLRRCLQTFRYEWTEKFNLEKIDDPNLKKTINVTIKENIRETIGVHTCDWRQNKSKSYDECIKPYENVKDDFQIKFNYEENFEEEDPLYSQDYRETDHDIDVRIERALNEIWELEDKKKSANPEYRDKVISLTCHEGVIKSALRVLKHDPIPRLETSGVVMVIITKL